MATDQKSDSPKRIPCFQGSRILNFYRIYLFFSKSYFCHRRRIFTIIKSEGRLVASVDRLTAQTKVEPNMLREICILVQKTSFFRCPRGRLLGHAHQPHPPRPHSSLSLLPRALCENLLVTRSALNKATLIGSKSSPYLQKGRNSTMYTVGF